MSKRLWLLGVTVLVSIGLLVACGSKYNSSSNGLLLVTSQGSGLIETFSFTLNNGHVAAIANSPADTANQTCVLNGVPSSIVMDHSGAYAYAIINANPSCSGSKTVIASFKVNSDGTVSAVSSSQTLNSTSPTVIVPVQECGTTVNETLSVTAPVVPNDIFVDAAGKYLFIAEVSSGTTAPVTYTCPGGSPTTVTVSVPVPGTVSVMSIGGGGSLSEVTGSPFAVPVSAITPSLVAVAATPTVFPGIGINGTQNSVCSVPGNNPPTSEYLYAVDSGNYLVWEFAVDPATGVLGNPPGTSVLPSFTTDPVPAGIAVDPCDRFVYVSDSQTNKVSAYTICTMVIVPTPCPNADGSLVAVAGSPFSLAGNAGGPGPLVVDPFGNNVYVVGTLSNTLSLFKISPISGALTALTPAVVATGAEPKSIAIRGDDNWMFVSNHSGPSVSQYSITPATGALSAAAPIQTDNYPWGVAVK